MFLAASAPASPVQLAWLGRPKQFPPRVREQRLSRGVAVIHFLAWQAISVLDANHALPLLTPPEPVKRRLRSPKWQELASCDGKDEELFFSEDPRLRVGLAAEARAVCAVCPVVRDCMTWALGGGPDGEREGFGIWAGSSRRQRLEMFDRIDAGATIADEVQAWLTKGA